MNMEEVFQKVATEISYKRNHEQVPYNDEKMNKNPTQIAPDPVKKIFK